MKRIATPETFESLAVFGAGALVKTPGGKYEFHGGSPADRAEAIEWASMFAHEIVVATN